MSSITPKTTLHGYFRSSAAYRVRIALNLKGIAYDSRTYHLRKGDQRTKRYLAVNPSRDWCRLSRQTVRCSRNPWQSLSIFEEQWPTPPLLPSSTLDRARVRAMAQIIACDIHPIDNLRVLAYLRGRLAQPEPVVRDWYAHWVQEGLSSLEVLLSNDPRTGEFCHGDSPGSQTCALCHRCLTHGILRSTSRPFLRLCALPMQLQSCLPSKRHTQ